MTTIGPNYSNLLGEYTGLEKPPDLIAHLSS